MDRNEICAFIFVSLKFLIHRYKNVKNVEVKQTFACDIATILYVEFYRPNPLFELTTFPTNTLPTSILTKTVI